MKIVVGLLALFLFILAYNKREKRFIDELADELEKRQSEKE